MSDPHSNYSIESQILEPERECRENSESCCDQAWGTQSDVLRVEDSGLIRIRSDSAAVSGQRGTRPLNGSIAAECRMGAQIVPFKAPQIPVSTNIQSAIRRSATSPSDRKFALIRRSGLFGADTRGAKISRAVTLEDLRAAYRLVHRIYLGKGYISEEEAKMRLRIFETSMDTATFIAKKNGKVVAVLSIVPDTKSFGLPSDGPFADELNSLRKPGLKLGEVTNQVVDEEFRNTAVPTELMRCALAHGIQAGFDLGVAAISPSHTGFYELLGFHQIGEKRTYSGKLHDPVVPVLIDLAMHREPHRELHGADQFMHTFLTAENPYLLYVDAWDNVAKEHFRDPEFLHQFFVKERNFLRECSDSELRALRDHWGFSLSRSVAGWLFDHRLGSPVDFGNACGRSVAGAPKVGRTKVGRLTGNFRKLPSTPIQKPRVIRKNANRGN